MNTTERQMLDILKKLRDENGVIAIKAEFEAEGSRTDELVKLNEIVYRADMKMYIKIGGCEAVRDLDQCILLGASGIMAPMIESPFAMQKFMGAAKKVYGDRINDIEWIINAETKTCHKSMDEIFDTAKGFLKTISIGRVDLSASMGLDRSKINDDIMLETAIDIAKAAKKRDYIVNFGGGISFDAIPFIKAMCPYADRFETRKVVFAINDDEKRLKQGIYNAMLFETLYLQNKCDFYGRMAQEDASRLNMMRTRLEQAKTEI
ncbi:MAG: aldolase [Clostridiales bacterium]|nr:aldolase [Clostridiales bacterium]